MATDSMKQVHEELRRFRETAEAQLKQLRQTRERLDEIRRKGRLMGEALQDE